MTDMEKKVMVRLCAKIVTETENWEIMGEIRNVKQGGYYTLFLVGNEE